MPDPPGGSGDLPAGGRSTWVSARTRYLRDHFEVAAIDPHAGYRKALVSSLPRATITVDVFHAVKLANSAVDDVRRRVQRKTLGHRGRNKDPLHGIRRLLTRGYERLSDKQRARITEALRRGDPYDEVGGAWAVKEQLRRVYEAESPREVRSRLERFYELARIAGTPEVLRLAKTIKRWEDGALSFFTTGRTNAWSEAMKLVTEKLRRNAHGIRDFENYRLRLLLHSGMEWNTQPTARIRGRHPRLRARKQSLAPDIYCQNAKDRGGSTDTPPDPSVNHLSGRPGLPGFDSTRER